MQPNAKVLIDPDATHSFDSLVFKSKLDVSSYLLLPVMSVSTPMGDTLLANKVYRSCMVVIEKELLVDLTVLEIQNFDLILRMDCLSTYHAKLNY